jgi:signal transduction histidine kinase
VTPEYQHDDYGYFLSGHAPIYDSKRTYSGFIGVDFDLGYYLAQEARFDRTFAGSVAAALLMSLGIGYVVARYYHLMQQRAAERERNRIARNVHDGVLQGLTAIALNLKTCSQRADSPLREELDAARQLLVGEQRRVRALVDGTRLSAPIKQLTLAAAAEELIAELEAQWHCEIPLKVKPENAEVSPNVVEQLRLILAEAVANSIKHGQARRVTIDMDRSLQGLGVNIYDNGTGFPALSGIYEHEDLSALDVGPRSILERVRELGGRVTLLTSSNGSQLRIHLPV